MEKKGVQVGECIFNTATELECLNDACYRVSAKIMESAVKWEKRSRKALEHNRKRVIDQLEKMDLIRNDQEKWN